MMGIAFAPLILRAAAAPARRRVADRGARRRQEGQGGGVNEYGYTVIASAAKQSSFFLAAAKLDCFVASAPLRKRFAFVAGNDGFTPTNHRIVGQHAQVWKAVDREPAAGGKACCR